MMCFSCGDLDATDSDSARLYYGLYGTRRLHFSCAIDQASGRMFSKRSMRNFVKKLYDAGYEATYEFNQHPSMLHLPDIQHPKTGEWLSVFRCFRDRYSKKKYAVCSQEGEAFFVELPVAA